MPWWDAPPLLEFLEQIEIATDRNLEDRRFPVQWVIRPMSDEHHDYRGYAGRVASGIWQAGDEVVVLPSGLRSRVAADRELRRPARGRDPAAVDHDPARRRRRRLARRHARRPGAPAGRRARGRGARLLDERAAARAAREDRRQAHDAHRARASSRSSCRSSTSARWTTSRRPGALELNDIGIVRLRLSEPLAVDPYAENRETGAFILIDEATNDTVGAGMIVSATP